MDHGLFVRGCVLKHKPVNDYDWLVTLLTTEKGKINAFARYARKPGTRLSGNVEPLGFGTFELYPGKSSYVLTGVQIDRYFETFRTDLELAAYGTFFLEIADYYSRENMEARDLLNLLYVSLNAVSGDVAGREKRLVRCVFELRAMVTEGVFPGESAAGQISDTLRHTLSHIASAPLKTLYSFALREDALEELIKITERFRRMVTDRPFNSLEMITLYEGEQHGTG